ncbi:MAG: pyruvate, phosphate dikinase [Candidatus Sumerlaeaceae bacterium]|nr:pyruvate, phosphate dikinase [Candidatus Sumerlaeaceae bacterium]
MAQKFVYFFGDGKSEGGAEMKNLLGGKGANLGEMARLGLPVPAGFTITTEVCTYYYQHGRKLPPGLDKEIRSHMARVEKVMGAKFGDPKNPLLVSVRSGARASMPGMMETVLNLGLNEQTLQGIIAKTKNERFAWDLYRRFVHMFSKVVMEIEDELFGRRLDELKKEVGVKLDTELNAEQLKQLTADYMKIYKDHVGSAFPSDPWKQLELAIGAVFQSWNKKKAVDYRKINNIPEWWGTAVNVCSMVYGNMGDDCATGVAFTRDPATGEKRFFGEWLKNAQGEDVVAGIRTPQPINEESRSHGDDGSLPTLEKEMPKCYKELVRIYTLLERHYKDMQDIEFTIQNGKLWMLQTRNGKRTATAAVRIAVDLVKEKLITPSTAVKRVDPDQLDQLLHPMFDPKAKKNRIAKGINASPGAAVGKVVFTADHAVEMKAKGEKVILVRLETSPEDVAGMHAAQGILTARGGKTSHAAVVARGMGKCCVCGAGEIHIDDKNACFTVGDIVVKEYDYISLDGSKGEVYLGQVPVIDSEIVQVLRGQMKPKDSAIFGYYETFMKWVDAERVLKVRTNADTPEDSRMAVLFGAEGIGLCRTEHMFFDTQRILHVRRMILSDTVAQRREALGKIIGYQRDDFYGIFKEMGGRPVTIRLLDPPLHEFLPHEGDREKIAEVAKELGVSPDVVAKKIVSLHEFNPMLGHRGCRLGIVYPEITEMQARAIFEAAAKIKKEGGKVQPEVMVPLTGTVEEMRNQKAIIVETAQKVMAEQKVKFPYLVGTMIEVPRAALVANEIAAEAEFFSFGTNDLTQMTFGFSRDDAGKFLPFYVENKILPGDPFQSLDTAGVGLLMSMAVKSGRDARPDLKCGICGEHGGDPASVKFCHSVGLDYVSCSPYRVPIARLAAAQAAVEEREAAAKGKAVTTAGSAKKSARRPTVPVAKKATAKKAAPKKAAAAKAAPKKAAAKKPAAKKAAPKKAAAKK